ncbi:DUF1385 domain-containing protein [Patescibacteria group bacterium]|nr:DUF1385 domain-containing protein [Patescibacteria group bacterium]
MTTEDEKIDFAIGGQAVIEGVMMRSPNFYTVTVRNEDGELKIKQEGFKSLTARIWGLKAPFFRGIVHLVESMVIGFRSLNFSSDVFIGTTEEEKEDRHPIMKVLIGIFGVLYMLGTLAFVIFLLKFLPLWVAEKAAEVWPLVENNYLLFNAIDGFTKITIFLSYVVAISFLKDIKRVFEYHGAEHKSIWAYEKGLVLTVENAKAQSRFHPRCGTSFIFIVILMSVVVYTFIPSPDEFWARLGTRILAIPIIAGMSYELLKLSAKWQKNFLVKMLIWPGLFIQKLTTREPDDSQLEVALHSLQESLKIENGNTEN